MNQHRHSRGGRMIAAVPTRYAGRRFRSRLEARWAVFFDALDIHWEYEPQGFDLDKIANDLAADFSAFKTGCGCDECHCSREYEVTQRLGWYLPDFWLPAQRIWLEIKGDVPSGIEEARLGTFGSALNLDLPGRQFVVCAGGVPRTDSPNFDGGWVDGGAWSDGYAHQYGPYWDNLWHWAECPECGALDMQFEGRLGRIYCDCDLGYAGDDAHHTSDRLRAAFVAARSARFEFGETPR